jgi:hypothetical protein
MPFRSSLSGLLLFAMAASPLHAARTEPWVEVRSPHFQAYGDARAAVVRDVLRAFEEIRVVFKQVFPTICVDPPRPMILIVVRDEASMKRFLPRQFEGRSPQRPAGLFLTTKDRDYAIVRMDAIGRETPQGMATVFHEYTHCILHLNFPRMPVWLDEGLADFYGATEIEDDRVVIGRASEDRLACLRKQPFLPLGTLLSVTHDSPDYQEGSRTGIFYSESWALVHYLLSSGTTQKGELFKAYMKALDADPNGLAAAKSVFGDLATFKPAFQAYAKQFRFHTWIFPRSAPIQAADLTETPVDPATALLLRAEFLDYLDLHQEARDVLRGLESAPPPGPAYQVALGMSAMNRNDAREAKRAFRKALCLGTKDFRAPAYLASLLRDGAGTEGAKDEPRALLEQALALRSDIPWVHSMLGTTLAQDPARASQAIQEARKAVDLEPIEGYLRANLGVTFMILGQEEGARSVGETLTHQARDAQDRALASAYGKQLDGWLARRKARAEAIKQQTIQEEAIKQAEALEAARKAPSVRSSLSRAPRRPNHPPVTTPFHFSLPDRLAPLGQDVLVLVSQRKLKAAQEKVRKALAQPCTPEERRALEWLSSQLKARITPGKN